MAPQPMILNERQYILTKANLRRFQDTAAEIEAYSAPEDDRNEQLRRQMHLDALRSQITTMSAELAEYDRLKNGEVKQLALETLAQLPEALIKARIARNLTQEQLGDRLNLKAQQIQRYEANAYAGANLSRLLEVQAALNVSITTAVMQLD